MIEISQNNLIIKKLLTIVFLFLSLTMFSHGDLTARIEQKTKEISLAPENFELYFERGLLYQQHIEYYKALDDYNISKKLGNSSQALYYRISEVYYLTEDFTNALESISPCIELKTPDVKAKKLQARILFNLKDYKQSLDAYQEFITNVIDLKPEDVLEYCDIILAENSSNYNTALNIIESGLEQIGVNTLSLQLKKLDYLKASNQTEKALEQYNYFILEYKRKEFWYYKKAKYLATLNKTQEANICLKLATVTIEQLDVKFKNMKSIIKLKQQIKTLETSLNN
ncbi:hypothetical protein SAMN04488096_10635 [Mesonia phycicola]|uniref:Uncharacterized protein n=1 Tax=Mesonia phycicola TaxID=579105 RepID=A0A1M6FAQ9_9FLAO|nr:hypothetical protein [Mesonia phycicola]SHI94755.1 hypothetical protein SAMN04488096_10635 [Mesonia phycicola]